MEIEKNLNEHSLAVLPQRARGSYTDNFRSIGVVSNHYEVKLTESFDRLYIFSVKFDPMIPRDNRQKRKEILQYAWPEITSNICNFFNLTQTMQPFAE
jgi:hypothetical protein